MLVCSIVQALEKAALLVGISQQVVHCCLVVVGTQYNLGERAAYIEANLAPERFAQRQIVLERAETSGAR